MFRSFKTFHKIFINNATIYKQRHRHKFYQRQLHDMELKLYPGMSTLTWTSMNIDSYLNHIHQGLNKLEQLIINVNDIIENRV